MKVFKITILILVVAVISMAGYIYINRHTIFDYNINKLIKNLLPGYIEAGDLDFDFREKRISIKNFKILNAPGFKHPYLVEISEVRCIYSQKNEQSILEGLKITNIDLIGPVIYIERLKDLKINVQHMDEVFKKTKKVKAPTLISKVLAYLFYLFSPVKKIEELLELEGVFNARDGRFVFDDSSVYDKGYRTTIESIDAKATLDLKKDFKGVDYVKSEGRGLVNGLKGQTLHWVTGYNPTTVKLTMSNTFNIKNVDFLHFKPYYDRFSPFIFKTGRASGELIFNFDNGDIGSMNEIRLTQLSLEVKKDQDHKDFWAVGTEDLHKYFASGSGEIVFDFKIKGNMKRPKFYLGSKTKRALAKMVFYKITDALLERGDKSSTEPQPPAGESQLPPGTQEEKSDIEKIIDIFKNIKESR